MSLPKSFLAFQKLFESTNLAEDGLIRGVDPEASGDEAARLKKVLGYSTDSILSAMHSQELLRDAVIDSFPNLANKSVLFVINPSLNDVDALKEFLIGHPYVKRFVLGARKLSNGERIRAVKVDVIEVDDEYGEPNLKDKPKVDRESNADQDALNPLSSTFNLQRGGPSE